MKKYIFFTALLVSVLIIPVSLNAAYNDVSLTTDADISVNSLTLDVSGSTSEVESITVNADNFTVTLQSGSSFTVTSSDKATFSVDSPGLVNLSKSCTSTESSITLTNASNVTVTIIPNSTACDSTVTTGGGGSSGGGGGGGGGGTTSSTSSVTASTPAQTQTTTTETKAEETTTTTTTTVTATTGSNLTQGQINSIIGLLEAFGAEQSIIDNVLLSLSGGGSSTATTAQISDTNGISAVFTKGLSRGMSGSDIKRLQQLLNSDPDTAVATSGVGSAGNETNYFGSLTQKAVQKFQAKYGIVSSGTPETTGYGLVGPKTRTKLAEVFGDTTTSTESTAPVSTTGVSAVFTKDLSRGSSNSDIKRLQQLLNSDPDTAVATSGVGSAGNETNFFGSLTEKAVQKFQLKHGVVADSNDPGYGYVGPKTRAKLDEVFGQ